MTAYARDAYLPERIAHAARVAGAFSFLNPTTRYVPIPAAADTAGGKATGEADASVPPGDSAAPAPAPTAHTAYQVWRSRDNRKGRHAVILTRHRHHHRGSEPKGPSSPPATRPKTGHGAGLPALYSSASLRGFRDGLLRMAVQYPVWDVSYDVAMVFTLGSMVWVVNAFFVWLPLAAPWTAFGGESSMGGGVTALVGATIFEVGAVLGLLEAVNENRADCFGYAVEAALEEGEMRWALALRPNPGACRHAHVQRRSLFRLPSSVRSSSSSTGTGIGIGGEGEGEDGKASVAKGSGSGDDGNRHQHQHQHQHHHHHPSPPPSSRQWSWWPSWAELRDVYVRETAFWACATQLVGATVFWIAGLTGIPPILDRLSVGATAGVYWAPQVVGGIGFIVSSLLLTLETQRRWYVPAPQLLGWHVGIWNLVGAIGFTLCGVLGFWSASRPAVAYATALSSFIGSWAFLIGSVVQWYESLDKYPIQFRDTAPAGLDQ